MYSQRVMVLCNVLIEESMPEGVQIPGRGICALSFTLNHALKNSDIL
ncbi:MAG: hypothetical protein HFH00_04630 [Dorea sp.]|nr:hypothetical protein [Dorea sp.]